METRILGLLEWVCYRYRFRMQDRREPVRRHRVRRRWDGVGRGWVALLVIGRLMSVVAADEPPSDRDATDVHTVDYVAQFWRTPQGLPDNVVNALLQTRDGYLWVGTARGLARFDGFKFTLIGGETAPVLEGARITALLEDRAGGLWVGTQGRGVVRLGEGETETFTRSDGLQDDNVTSLAEDGAGAVWIGTQGGLSRWQAGRVQPFASAPLRPGEPIVALHAGRSGVLWVTTRFEVYRLRDGSVELYEFEDMPQGRTADFVGVYEDRAGDLWTYGATFLQNVSQGRRFNYFRSLDPVSSRFWTICEQENGAFWIGTSGRGLFRFQEGRFEITGARHGLDQCDVRALQADHEGNLWIGTSGSGLVRLRTQQWELIRTVDGASASRVTAVAVSPAGEMSVGTADRGVFRVNALRQLEPLSAGPPLTFATQIEALCADAEGGLWVGTWGAGLIRMHNDRQSRYTTAEGLTDDVVLALAAEHTGDAVWAGTLDGGLHRVTATNVVSLSREDGLPGEAVVCLRVGPGGDVLIGTAAGGLFQYDGNRVRRVDAPRDLDSSVISCFADDQQGRLWVGTIGAGAFCRIDRTWVKLGKGMLSEVVRQIIQDDAGHYWFNSDRGILQVQAEDVEDFLRGRINSIPSLLCRRETGAELPADQFGFAPAVRTDDQSMWFVTSEGLLRVDPKRTRVAVPPRVIIEEVLVNGEVMMASTLGSHVDQLRIAPGMRSLDFSFTAISFTAPEQTRFRHMLEGSDLDWVESDMDRREHYGPLAPGRYRFRVIAANGDGIWNEVGDSLLLVVVTPFWRSWWFVGLVIGASVALVWLAARYVSFRRLQARLRVSEQRRAMERERARIAQDMHDEIGSKLTRISFLSEAARNAGAGGTSIGPQVTSIATTSRELLQALDEIVWAVNPRNDNLEHLAGYLEQYAREYFQGTAVECRISVPDQLPLIPLGAETRHNVFLAFEEALSNALQHARATEVCVEMKLRPESFELVVRDNGCGFQVRGRHAPLGHDGLRNMKERLHSIGGLCMIGSQPGRGTTIRLRVPRPVNAKPRASKAAIG